jgi:hypothetical protein
MTITSRKLAFAALATVLVAGASPAAQAQDFFSALFGGMIGSRQRAPAMPFANDGQPGLLRPHL